MRRGSGVQWQWRADCQLLIVIYFFNFANHYRRIVIALVRKRRRRRRRRCRRRRRRRRTKKFEKKRSLFQMIDQVMTINSVQKSSKSELSSRFFGRLKILATCPKSIKITLADSDLRKSLSAFDSMLLAECVNFPNISNFHLRAFIFMSFMFFIFFVKLQKH